MWIRSGVGRRRATAGGHAHPTTHPEPVDFPHTGLCQLSPAPPSTATPTLIHPGLIRAGLYIADVRRSVTFFFPSGGVEKLSSSCEPVTPDLYLASEG